MIQSSQRTINHVKNAKKPPLRQIMKISEHEEQVALFQWAKLMEGRCPALKNLFAVPNGGLRNPIVAKKLKAEGVKAGVPDIFLAYPTFFHNGLFIEMKSGKEQARPIQKAWHKSLLAVGYQVAVCYSANEAIEAIEKYLTEK